MTIPKRMITPEVAAAIEEVLHAFPGCPVTFEEDGQGGAYVTVTGIDIGPKYEPNTTWCSFHITFQYPRADVYPHFIAPNILRTDRCAHGQGIGSTTWREKPVLQLSRRSNRWDAATDTAALKLAKVMEWFRKI